MDFEPCNLWKMYSEAELEWMFSENPLMSAEYDPTFLGFEDLYEAASVLVPRDAVIVDAGCCLGLQGRYFERFRDYIGIDLPDPPQIAGYPPNKKAWELFKGFPGRYIEGDATLVLSDMFIGTPRAELERILVIVSAVPDERVYRTAERLFPNTLLWYPGDPVAARGRWSAELNAWFSKSRDEKHRVSRNWYNLPDGRD